MKPILTHCCFCFSLAPASYPLGRMNVVMSALSVLTSVVALIHIKDILAFETRPDGTEPYDQLIRSMSKLYLSTTILCMMLNFSQTTMAIILVIEASKRNEKRLMPWLLTFNMTSILIYLVMTIIIAYYDMSFLFVVLFLFVTITFEVYLWVCLLSVYQAILQNSRRHAIDTTFIQIRRKIGRIPGAETKA